MAKVVGTAVTTWVTTEVTTEMIGAEQTPGAVVGRVGRAESTEEST